MTSPVGMCHFQIYNIASDTEWYITNHLICTFILYNIMCFGCGNASWIERKVSNLNLQDLNEWIDDSWVAIKFMHNNSSVQLNDYILVQDLIIWFPRQSECVIFGYTTHLQAKSTILGITWSTNHFIYCFVFPVPKWVLNWTKSQRFKFIIFKWMNWESWLVMKFMHYK
jgi:hypothetical protein